MTIKERIFKELSTALSYILVAALAVVITLAVTVAPRGRQSGLTKLEQLQQLLEECYIDIDKVDLTEMEDAAAEAMIAALGDRWSYYISAKDFADMADKKANSYVGVGVTIAAREDGQGFTVQQVSPGGSALEQGVLPGDIIVEVAGESIIGKDSDYCRDLVRGEAGTTVTIGVMRNGEKRTFTLTRKRIQVPVATGEMLQGNIGLVTIANFDERCYSETKAVIEDLKKQGATSLIFDVRNNPGGYKNELVKLLDYLLPAGDLFKSVDYTGATSIDKSGASCLKMPMAVLINKNSYSAAEFFAAALAEYDWATIVGDPTSGKGKFQYTYQFTDGSGIGLSVGKYYTPKGVSLADQGGIVPEALVEVSDELAAKIYGGLVTPAEDPQIQAAVGVLTKIGARAS